MKSSGPLKCAIAGLHLKPFELTQGDISHSSIVLLSAEISQKVVHIYTTYKRIYQDSPDSSGFEANSDLKLEQSGLSSSICLKDVCI